jgi:polyisoprenoid-binding protein YceI
MPNRLTFVFCAVMLVAAAQSATAPSYTLDPARSSFKFGFIQGGAENQGRFKKFNATLRFADASLATSRIELTLDVGSLITGDEDRDTEIKGAELFDVAKFPQARFVAGKFARVSAGRYDAIGKLTIRNVTRDVRIPFSFRSATEAGGATSYITGRFPIKLPDYGVGQGEWKTAEQVTHDVNIVFNLRFVGAPAAAPAQK